MAASAGPTATSVPRGNSMHSSLGTHAPLNTPTRPFTGSHERTIVQEPGVPNPNVYVVQPFKNASRPKDLVYTKKVIIEIIYFKRQLINKIFRMHRILAKIYLILQCN